MNVMIALRLSIKFLLCITAFSRVTAVTVTVSTTADSGLGSLRDALQKINAVYHPSEKNRIIFNLATNDAGYQAQTGSWRIIPVSSLPVCTRQVEIDGYSQPGAVPNTNPLTLAHTGQLKIEITGPGPVDDQNLPVNGLVLGIGSDGSSIKGLCINRFANTQGAGILIQANVTTIQGCFIGSDISGMVSMPNGSAIINEGNDTCIGDGSPAGRNLISGGYGSRGVIAKLLGSLSIVGNTIGLNKDGKSVLASECPVGIVCGVGQSKASLVSQNVIAGHTGANIYVNLVPNPSSLSVVDNKIGTDISGTEKIDGNGIGIALQNAPSALSDTFEYETISIEGNLISGNTYGIMVRSATPGEARGTDVRIVNNSIGLNAQETLAIPNSLDGIWLERSLGTIIQRNRISGNRGNGIHIDGSKNVLIRANLIGVNKNFEAFSNEGNGIQLGSNNVVGSTAQDVVLLDNKVRFNAMNGVALLSSVHNVAMKGNDCEDNLLSGVFLGPDTYNNTVGGCEGDFYCADGKDCLPSPIGNSIKRNGKSGIVVSNYGKNAILQNVVENDPSGEFLSNGAINIRENEFQVSAQSLSYVLRSKQMSTIADGEIIPVSPERALQNLVENNVQKNGFQVPQQPGNIVQGSNLPSIRALAISALGSNEAEKPAPTRRRRHHCCRKKK